MEMNSSPSSRMAYHCCGAMLFLLLVNSPVAEALTADTCDEGKFGTPYCNETCHCYKGPCDALDGTCDSDTCDFGWKDPPRCQTPCDGTFGQHCISTCHCPVDDTCDPVNGLCSSGRCDPEWTGSGCQTRLPKLIGGPVIVNASCGRVILKWNQWKKNYDSGDGPVHSYIVLYTNDSVNWTEAATFLQDENATQYMYTVTDLFLGSEYKFRIDTNMADEGKKVDGPPGVESTPVLIDCLSPSPEVTTQAPLLTTLEPHTTIISTSTKPTYTEAPPIFNEITITDINDETGAWNLTWSFLDGANSLEANVSLTIIYRQIKIGDCNATLGSYAVLETVNTSNNATIEGLEPWRTYIIVAHAQKLYTDWNHTVSENLDTGETAPAGMIENVTIHNMTSRSAWIFWNELPCELRNGPFLRYEIEWQEVNSTANISRLNITDPIPKAELRKLNPDSEYLIRIAYMNSAGTSNITEKPFKTLEDVPSAPLVEMVTSTATTVTVKWLAPDPSNGEVIGYKVSYTDEHNRELIETPSLSSLNEVTLRSLMPYHNYETKVAASTSVGWGPYSAVENIMTKQDAPSMPQNVTIIETTETCVQLTWKAPANANGILTQYKISYVQEVTHAISGLNRTEVIEIVSHQTDTKFPQKIRICNLQPATYYRLRISASTIAGFGASTEILAVTKQDAPPTLQPPTVIDASFTTISVSLDPIHAFNGPVTSYQLIVHMVESVGTSRRRKKRALGNVSKLPGYITAELRANDIATGTVFVIGDGKTYGGYTNRKLTANKFYDIYFVIISKLQDTIKFSHSKIVNQVEAKGIVIDTTVSPPVDQSTDNSTVIIIVVVVILLIIITVLAILFLVWWYRRRKSQKYLNFSKPTNPPEKLALSVYSKDTELEQYWSQTFALSQTRHIIAGQEHVMEERAIPKTLTSPHTAAKQTGKITFHKEFYSLPHKKKDWSVAVQQKNKNRNRFDHLLAYDHSRVILEPDENSDNDYINASYIDGCKRRKAYIAAQSPFNEQTVLDFWRMIYQLRISTVVMITKVEEADIVKCTQYWPDSTNVATFANFVLKVEDIQYFANFVVRVISIASQKTKSVERVRIYDYTSWPEHGVPRDATPLIELREKVRYTHTGDGPILVHCGTGVARTAVFIAIDALMEQYEKEKQVNVFKFVQRMREHRVSMVRTMHQYVFIYQVLFEAFLAGNTWLDRDNLKPMYRRLVGKNPRTNRSFMKDQFMSLRAYTPKIKKEECRDGLNSVNCNKNRYNDLLPADEFRPVINTLGGVARTNYINAVFLDGYRQKKKFIITQTPMSSTVLDFWKMVHDYNVRTIVMMEPVKVDDDSCIRYWPDDGMLDIKPYFVEFESQKSSKGSEIKTLDLKLYDSQMPHAKPQEVKLFQFNCWQNPAFAPSSKAAMLDLLELVEAWQKLSTGGCSPIVVHCRDGATQSGLFCACAVLCEHLEVEGKVSAYHTIKQLKRRRTQILDHLEQYHFCYKILWDFLNVRMDHTMSGSAEKIYSAPSLNISLYSSLFDEEDEEVDSRGEHKAKHQNLQNQLTFDLYSDMEEFNTSVL